ncbi:glycosyltransferase family 32 protein [Sphingomonas sp. PAMC 26617]|uniref:glycosyltransferase family 32 protein n=1 Tax=Sphingomonas sp. PAMC 26617 TaxID=1112216 RepID=UPI0002880C28|nr:glycosyltransferase [Sphingomonas sp. PAMC 26617]
MAHMQYERMLLSDIPFLGALHATRRRRREEHWAQALLAVPMGTAIPRIVHQTYATDALPEAIRVGREDAIAQNPDWDFRLYSDDAIETFIGSTYGAQVLSVYRLLRPEYGAARADLFRYLLIYALGGAYLDIKSRFTGPINAAIRGNESFILAQWRNGPGELHFNMGLLDDIADIPGGEYQQWHVIGVAGHPYLRAVIAAVLANIETYSPWMTNVGRIGVLRLTGPIAYTRAIHPIRDAYPHVLAKNETQFSLEYSGYKRATVFAAAHYSTLTTPIVRRGLASAVSGWVFRQTLRLTGRTPDGGVAWQ